MEYDEDTFLILHNDLTELDYEDWSAAHEALNPREDPPFVVHHYGPDDVYPARTWREAVGIAHQLNAGAVAYTRRTKNDGLVRSWAQPYRFEDAVAAGVVRSVNHKEDGR